MNTMYFTCSTLRTVMRVSACEKNRSDKNPSTIKQVCKGCPKWESETTDPKNLKTQEEVLNPIQIEQEKPKPVRFDHRADIQRVGNLHIGHTPYRDITRRT